MTQTDPRSALKFFVGPRILVGHVTITPNAEGFLFLKEISGTSGPWRVAVARAFARKRANAN